MYAIEFECEETGEHGFEGPFDTWDEAMCKYDYPGYGKYRIVEISNDEAIDILIANIDEEVDIWISEMGDIDPEDYEIVEPAWQAEATRYIEDQRPGWRLLKAHLLC